jgi:hypothetical protein
LGSSAGADRRDALAPRTASAQDVTAAATAFSAGQQAESSAWARAAVHC